MEICRINLKLVLEKVSVRKSRINTEEGLIFVDPIAPPIRL